MVSSSVRLAGAVLDQCSHGNESPGYSAESMGVSSSNTNVTQATVTVLHAFAHSCRIPPHSGDFSLQLLATRSPAHRNYSTIHRYYLGTNMHIFCTVLYTL